MKKTKKATYLAAAMLLAGANIACEQEGIYDPVDFRVALNAGNTYRTGEPVVFNFEGNADFITVWNGDTGHEYRFRERTSVDPENIRSCKLHLDIAQGYGDADPKTRNMDILVTNQFKGLSGNDPQADGEAIRQIAESGHEGWEVLDYVDERNTSYPFTEYTYDITRYADNFALGLHFYHAAEKQMRTYYVNPRISVQFEGSEPQFYTFAQLGFVPFRTAGLYTEQSPYISAADTDIYKVNQSGLVKLKGQKNAIAGAEIAFQGFTAGKPVSSSLPDLLFQPIDQWVMMRPLALNTIAPDTGVNIKGYADDVTTYSCVYNQPGTYTVSFVAATGNYEGQSRIVREMTVTIVDPIME